jgi:uncharacterized protein
MHNMHRKRQERIRLPGPVAGAVLLALCCSAALRGADTPVYVIQFAQSGSAPAFPDLARFLTYSIRVKISQVPQVQVSVVDRNPCETATSGGKDEDKRAGSTYYTIRGSIEIHQALEQGAGAEVLVSYELAKGATCPASQTVSTRTGKFVLSEVLDAFTSIGDKLSADLTHDIRPPIQVDILPVSVKGGGKSATRAADLLSSYLNFRLAGADDITPHVKTAGDSNLTGDFGLKGEIEFSADGATVQGQVQFLTPQNTPYPVTKLSAQLPKDNADEALAGFVLNLASAAATDLGSIRTAKKYGVDQNSSPAALLAQAKASLCELPGTEAKLCVKQPQNALALLARIRTQDVNFDYLELKGRANSLNGDSAAASANFSQALTMSQANVPANRLRLLRELADSVYAVHKYDQAAQNYEEYFRLAQKHKTDFPDVWAHMAEACVNWSHSAWLKGDKMRAVDILIESRGALGDRPELQSEFKFLANELPAADLTVAIAKLTAVLPPNDPVLGESMKHMGDLYSKGDGVAQDYVEARHWYERAADAGNARANLELGTYYEYGRGVAVDYAEARRWYEKGVTAGDAWSMTNLGYLYSNGNGVPQDYAQARKLYERGAALGDDVAMNNIGDIYEKGKGVPQDYPTAIMWYRKAADAGDQAAMENLAALYANGTGVAQDYAVARQLYEKAAAAGSASAMTEIGILYDYGRGVPQDFAFAKQWYEKGAAAGDSWAMTNLGVLYRNGHGVPQSDVLARQWYEKAADAGDPLGMVNLGWMYETGSGISRDYARARSWYEKGVAAGNALAMRDLGHLYEAGLGVSKDNAKAREYYQKAADLGNGQAMMDMGNLYEKGQGVSKNIAQAREWYEKALKAGETGAKARLDALPR